MSRTPPLPQGPSYEVVCLDLHAHLYRVSLTVQTQEPQVELALPVWIPGSYLVREFSQHVQSVRATREGMPLPVVQTRKNHWQVGNPGAEAGPGPEQATLTVVYEVYAFDASVRTAWLDAERGFFNGTSLLMRVLGQDAQPHWLRIAPPDAQQWPRQAQWACATALVPHATDAKGFGTYTAPNYAALVDEPVEMGAFWSGGFSVRGIPHRLVVSGAPPNLDAERLLADTCRICEAEVAFWHGETGQPPFDRYVFLLHATHDGYGGLEHAHSTALICPRADLPQRQAPSLPKAELKATDGYTSLLGLIAHEYFHTWNVKRLRPEELAQPDLDGENLTSLLWWFEGFTSYYDDLMLLRAGLIGTETYLGLLAKNLQQVAQTPGRHIHSVAQASLEAWTKYYRVQENTPNATVSYYTKGALVALCLDLTLRQHGSGLDQAMRAAWRLTSGGPLGEGEIRSQLAHLAGRPLDVELDRWVHGTEELPVLDLLRQAGIKVQLEAPSLAQRLGLRVQETQGLTVRNVLRGGLAEQAGLAAGDEWLAVQTSSGSGLDEATSGSIWRITRLDEIPPLLGEGRRIHAWVSRDRRIHRLPLNWPDHGAAPLDDAVFWLGQALVQLSANTEVTRDPTGWPTPLPHEPEVDLPRG